MASSDVGPDSVEGTSLLLVILRNCSCVELNCRVGQFAVVQCIRKLEQTKRTDIYVLDLALALGRSSTGLTYTQETMRCFVWQRYTEHAHPA